MRSIIQTGESRRLSKRHRFGAAVSTLAIAAMLPTTAFAQDTPATEQTEDTLTDEGGAIIVSGIRYSIANSIGIKERETSIVEAISAEEIGKLPDVSIAESIARLPGLAAQRVSGRAQTISLRGFSPDFTTTLLNGRQQASSGDNRSAEFDQYPSELLGSVVVYKTPDAGIAGMGLAGAIDLRTVRPLTHGKRTIAVNLRGEYTDGEQLNDDVRNYGWRGSLSYIDQNADGTLGWAFGYAHLDAPAQNRHYKAYNYETFGGRGGNISPDTADASTFVTGQEIFAYSRQQKRDAAIGILEWQPSESVHTTLDLYYSRFKQRETMRGAQWFSNVWADSQQYTNVTNATIGGTVIGVTGTNTGVAPIVRNDYNTRNDELYAIGLNNEFQLDERTRFIADLSYSRNKRDESITETYAGAGCCVTSGAQNANRTFDTINWNFTDFLAGNGYGSYDEGLNYADASRISLGDRAPWGGWGHDGQTKDPHVVENVWSIDMAVDHDFGDGFLRNVEVGVNFTHRDKQKRVDEYDLMLKSGRLQTLVGSQFLVSPTSLGYAGFGNVLSVNLPTAIPQYYDRVTFINNDTYDKSWRIDEDLLTLHAKATFETGPLKGNVGLQMVSTAQASTGSAINRTVTPTSVIPIREGASYTDLLPNVNLSFELGSGMRLRAAYARTMARPRMDELRANFTPSFSNPCGGSPPCVPGQVVNPWSASGGNAKLEPWRADAFDLTYEWYIGRASYFAINGFYKKLDNYIYTQRQAFDFSGLPLPPTAANIPAGVIISPIGQINQPANGTGGNVRGIEVAGALELGKITSLLDGFGVLGSYSYTLSSLRPTASTNPTVINATRIPGLSKDVYHLTAYFEKWGFQARVNYNYRSGFKGETTQLFAVRGSTEILADKDVSAQIGYTFAEGSALGGLNVLFQINNLTDSAYGTRLGVDNGGVRLSDGSFVPETYEKYGRQFLFGISYKF
jgi:iron complex outermembrane receptor protein